MSVSAGASSSSALSYLQSLMQRGAAQETKKASSSDPLSMLMQAISGDTTTAQTQSTATATHSTGAGCPQFSSGTMSALLSAQGQQSADSPSAKLFAKLDTDGDGQVSKSEFSDAANQAGADSSLADAVFAKIDSDNDGAISQDELTTADQGAHHRIGAGPPPSDGAGAGSSAAGGGSGSSSATEGATTSTTTNADGSTTTTITYADGSKVSMTTAASAEQSSDTSSGSTDSAANSSTTKSAFNLLEQLIKLQSEMLTAAKSTVSAIA